MDCRLVLPRAGGFPHYIRIPRLAECENFMLRIRAIKTALNVERMLLRFLQLNVEFPCYWWGEVLASTLLTWSTN